MKRGIAERIIDRAMNGSGVSDTGRVLKISPATVVRHLKTQPTAGEPLSARSGRFGA